MSLAQALAGEIGPDGIRWIVYGSPFDDVLRNDLEPLLSDGYRILRADLTRVKFKPGRKLSAYYDVRLTGPRDRPIPNRPIAVVWKANGAASGPAPNSRWAQSTAVSRDLAAPFSKLAARRSRPDVQILISPLDERFPELAQWSDPSYVARALETTDSGRHAVSVVRYRPGQRHVLAYGSKTPGETQLPSHFIKLSAVNDGGRPLRTSETLGRWLHAQTDSLSAASSVGQFGSAVLFPRVDGVALSHCIRMDYSDLGLALARAGEMLGVIHELPAAMAAALELPRHEFATEVAATVRAAEHVNAMSPSLGSRIHRLLDAALTLYQDLPQEEFAFVHGDFKADHLWISPHGATLIDFDSARISDPSLDVGKMLADLWWWYEDRPSAVAAAQRCFLESYSAGIPPERIGRARLYEAIFLAKAGARRIAVFDPDWERRVEAFVQRAELGVADAQRHGPFSKSLRKVFAAEGSDRS